MKPPVVVIGGGAAGMMAALAARQEGAEVTLLERNPKVGRKLYITGKGRCNLTNHCDVDTFLANVPRNGRFLYSALTAFPPSATEEFFKELGVPLKIERGSRVFPVSDKSADIIDALFFALRRAGVPIVEARATSLTLSRGQVAAVAADVGVFPCAAAILATGGMSYPATGSTGDGYTLAQGVGHTVTPLQGSLVPLEAEGCAAMQGLSLRNVALTVKNQKGKVLYHDQGELLFTHFGLSGPLALSASAHLRHFDSERYTALLDLKPALTPEQLDSRLLRDLEEFANQDMGNYVHTLVPRLLGPVLLERAGIDPHLKFNTLSKSLRRTLIDTLKALSYPLTTPRPVEEAIVTSGGVSVKEVDPKTMASKVAKGLFLAGELLDVDGYTGGFNLQIAWSTGHAAGRAAADYWKGCAL